MIRRPPRSTLSSSSAASDVYKRQVERSPPCRRKASKSGSFPGFRKTSTRRGSDTRRSGTEKEERRRILGTFRSSRKDVKVLQRYQPPAKTIITRKDEYSYIKTPENRPASEAQKGALSADCSERTTQTMTAAVRGRPAKSSSATFPMTNQRRLAAMTTIRPVGSHPTLRSRRQSMRSKRATQLASLNGARSAHNVSPPKRNPMAPRQFV